MPQRTCACLSTPHIHALLGPRGWRVFGGGNSTRVEWNSALEVGYLCSSFANATREFVPLYVNGLFVRSSMPCGMLIRRESGGRGEVRIPVRERACTRLDVRWFMCAPYSVGGYSSSCGGSAFRVVRISCASFGVGSSISCSLLWRALCMFSIYRARLRVVMRTSTIYATHSYCGEAYVTPSHGGVTQTARSCDKRGW